MTHCKGYILQAVCAMLLLASCTGNGGNGNRAPIVLGDTSTIVTEEDSRYTKDMVADLHPNIPTKTHKDEDEQAAPVDTATTPTTTTNTTSTTPPVATAPAKIPAIAPPSTTNGLTIPFKEVSLTIPGIAVKSYRPQDAARANGVSYQLVSGVLNNNRIIVNSGTVLKVSQRYQSQLAVTGEDGTLILDNLNTTTDWEPLAGGKNTYTIKGLEGTKLQAPSFTNSTLRAAITRAARRHRISRKREEEYQASVRNVRRANQKNLTVSLRSVMWKIDGKDAAGRTFSKQVRVDLPQ